MRTRVPVMGRPMERGEPWLRTEGVIWMEVVATVASVGP